jgi:hypothetical protein
MSDVTITICPSLYDYAKSCVPRKGLVTLIENSIFEEVRFARPVFPVKRADSFF